MKKLVVGMIMVLFPFLVWGGVDFDGSDDRIEISTNFGGYSEITVSCWVYIDSGTTYDPIVISGRIGAYATQKDWILQFGDSSTKLRFQVSDGATVINASSSTAQPTGTWINIIGEYDGQTAKIYEDNVEKGSASFASSRSINNAGNNVSGIGGALQQTTLTWEAENFNGKITEVYIWSKALTSSERALLSSGMVKRIGLSIQPSYLEAYWPLDDGADGTSGDGFTYLDYSGNGNDGTGNDGSNNTGLTNKAEEILSYPE